MAFKAIDSVLAPDPRYSDIHIIEEGHSRALTIDDHYGVIAGIRLQNEVPQSVRDAFDRARNALLYAWFSYDLLIVAESQALGTFELALKMRTVAMNWRMARQTFTLRPWP